MSFEPKSRATAIGSFPNEKAEDACALVFRTIPEIPTWPQLPKKSFFEDMNNQYSSRLPGFFIDEVNKKSGFNTANDFPGELERFYTRIIEEDLDYFGLDETYSAGFHHFVKSIPDLNKDSLFALKGQITGPLTLGLLTDLTDGKYALYKPDLFDAIVKNCTMNAIWQVKELKKLLHQVIIFFDEPSLSVIGSGFYSVDHSVVINSFNEIIKGIKDAGGIAGTHCCGNADWDDLLSLDIDIVNFDASDDLVLDKFLNAKKLNAFLERGSVIAWGIVPTIGEKIERATYDDIENNFRNILKKLSGRGIKEADLLTRSIITPSCGTGTLSIPLSEKALDLTKKLSDALRA